MTKPDTLRVAIACGGTGGHIYPGIAVARALESLGDTECLFIGTANRMEAEVIPREGFPFRAIRVDGFQRSMRPSALRRNLANLGRLGLGLPIWEARRHLREFQSRLVIGVGGYMSGPVLLAAKSLRLTTAIIEPNAYPGLTNRLLAPLVGYTAVAHEDALDQLHPGGVSEVTGNPLRPGFLGGEASSPAVLADFDGAEPLVLVFGGSLGAKVINGAVSGLLELVQEGAVDLPPLRILHAVGARYAEALAPINHDRVRYKPVPYLDEMAAVMGRASVAITRSGAGTVAELTALGTPAILVPWPGATDNHQESNARALEKAGAALVLRDDDCTPEHLAEALRNVLNPEANATMREQSRRLGRPDAALRIARTLRVRMGYDDEE